jgi:hypothetical protein
MGAPLPRSGAPFEYAHVWASAAVANLLRLAMVFTPSVCRGGIASGWWSIVFSFHQALSIDALSSAFFVADIFSKECKLGCWLKITFGYSWGLIRCLIGCG